MYYHVIHTCIQLHEARHCVKHSLPPSLLHPVEVDVLVEGDGERGSLEMRVVELTKKTDAEKYGRAIQVHRCTLNTLPAHLHDECVSVG